MSNGNLTLLNIVSIGIFGFFFGGFETLTNLVYLLFNNLNLPRKQHGAELPQSATDREVRMKVIQMLFLGITLLILAIASVIVDPLIFFTGGVVILISALIDVYKFGMTKMLAVWTVIAFMVMVASLFA